MIVDDLPLFQPLPDVAPSRTPSRSTSLEAAESVRNLTSRHRAVWECLRRLGPSADFQLEAAYDRYSGADWWVAQTPQSLRSRRAMLAHPHYGLVVTDGSKVRNAEGRNALVWAAVNPERAKRLW